MLTKTQIALLFTVERRLDPEAQPGWVSAEWNNHRAAILACSVMMEQNDWLVLPLSGAHKESLLLKLADVWHFYVLQFLEDAGGDVEAAQFALAAAFARPYEPVQFDFREYDVEKMDLLGKIKLMIGLAASNRVSVPLFSCVLADAQIEWVALYKAFVGRSVLDVFRRDHGYRKGRYVKVWNAQSDEVHLSALQDKIDFAGDAYFDEIYRGLEALYPVRSSAGVSMGAN
jgi:hypothetical protein